MNIKKLLKNLGGLMLIMFWILYLLPTGFRETFFSVIFAIISLIFQLIGFKEYWFFIPEPSQKNTEDKK